MMFFLIMKGKTQIYRLDGGFLNDHSEPLGEVFHMPVGTASSVAFVLVCRLGSVTAR